MKKKVVVLSAVLFFALSVISAFAGTGSYKGFPQVKLIVNDREITGEVPAINMDGNTLVPLRVVAESLGASVAWDAEAQTAIIRNTEPDTDGSEHKTPDQLQQFLNQFFISLQETKNLHERIKLIYDIQEVDPTFNRINDELKKIEDQTIPHEYVKIDALSAKLSSIVNESNKDSQVLVSANDQLIHYSDAIDIYKKALKEYEQYREDHESDDLRNFLLFLQDGYTLIANAESFLLEQLSSN